MTLRILTVTTLLSASLLAQDFERVAPKQPDEFEAHHGKVYGQNEERSPLTNGDQILIANLKGVLLTDGKTLASNEELQRTIGGVDTLNVQVPGHLSSFNTLITQKFLNKPLTKEGILNLKHEIILYYRRWGRPVVTLEIPQQKVTDGVLQIIVTEGKLGKVKVEGNKFFKEEALKSYIRLEEGEAINSDILITDVNWINRNPFRQVDVIYGPGDIVGTTDIRLLTTDRRPWRAYCGIDNTGYDETGNTRLFTGANWGNVFGLDHMLSLQFTSALNPHRFWALTGHYTIPLPWRHIWEVFGGYSQVHGNMKTNEVNNSGYSAQVSTRYNFIMKPLPGYLHDFIVGADYKRTNNNIDSGGSTIFLNGINLTQFVLGYNGAYDADWFKTSLSLEVFYSPGQIFGDQSENAYSKIQYKATPYYFYTRFTLAPILRLPKDFAFAVTVRGQLSTKNLVPSEQYGLGGFNTVRGYKEREFNVDDALLTSIELRTPPLSFIGKRAFTDMLQFLAFLDYGIGRNVATAKDQPITHYLLSFGPGVRYEISPYLNFRGDLGIQLHRVASPGFRFHFGLVASY